MWRIIILILIQSFLFSIFCVQASESTFTYVEGNTVNYGKSKREMIDVAICIDEPSLAGYKLKNVKAYISTTEGISETSIWLSQSLNLEDNKNIPDIGSFMVNPKETILEDLSTGLLEVSFDEPYVLTKDPIFIGYSRIITSE